ncbi:MAG: hypothetical protein ABI910_18455 [Gemmatimonadota bacterium]
MMTSGADVGLAAVVLGSVSGTIITVVRVLAARSASRERGRVTDTPDVDVRLGRMEQAIDAIAVEVQRLSESPQYAGALPPDRRPAAEKALPNIHTS